jgi:hypothetical protein
MVRILVTYVIPLVVPVVAWFLWQHFFAQPVGPDGTPRRLRDAPWPWLGLAGVVLVAGLLGSIALFGGGRPGEVYVPPQVIDGKVVPGRHLPPDGRD